MASIEGMILDSMKDADNGLFSPPKRVYHKGHGDYPEAVNVKDTDTMHGFTIQKGDIWSHEMDGKVMMNRSGAWLTDKNGLKILGSVNPKGGNIADWIYDPEKNAPKSTNIARHGEKRDRVTIKDKNGNEYEMGYKAYLESLK